jgi:hypothetical protein
VGGTVCVPGGNVAGFGVGVEVGFCPNTRPEPAQIASPNTNIAVIARVDLFSIKSKFLAS